MTTSALLRALGCLTTAVALSGQLAGCSTPQAALDQANATAGLVNRFEVELAAFR